MIKFIPRLFCLCFFVFLCSVADAAPVGSVRGIVRDVSSVNYSPTTSAVIDVGGVPNRRDAVSQNSELFERSWNNDEAVLNARFYVEDGSEMEVIERRGIKEFFQNLGHKIKEGFQNLGNKLKDAGQKIKQGFQTAGAKIKEGFQTAGAKIKQGFQTAGAKIKQGFQTAGTKIKEGFQTAGKKMKEGFQKAGKWIKETGAKVAKFGLKVIATAQAVAAHVVRFIPVVGQVASAALKASSFGLNKASDAIHADLGDKLNKGMKVMDIIQDPIGALAKKAVHEAAPHVQAHMAAHAAGKPAPHTPPHHAPPPPYSQHPPAHNPPPYHQAAHSPPPNHPAPPAYHAQAHAAAHAPPPHHAPPPPHPPPPAHHAPPPPHHH